ncbi:hypothetical protein, partial [Ralstonia solanacearum]|uniref:hypothetical protein n=1 Tax=Ralstonia solanacearum TaxID=305 RepID=UPI001CC2E275
KPMRIPEDSMGRHFAKLACQCHDKNRDRIMFLQSSNAFEKSDWVIRAGPNNRPGSRYAGLSVQPESLVM